MNHVFSALVYSMMAYGDVFTSLRFPKVAFISCKKSGVQYYIGKNDEELLIAFRGSDSKLDALHDLMFFKRSLFCGVSVHAGFLSAYEQSDVADNIRRIVCPCGVKKIYITGHSLGAALAILCALDLSFRTEIPTECTVFGSPRVGNSTFSLLCRRKIPSLVRVMNGNDAICKLPPACLSYRHSGNLMHIGRRVIPFFYSFRDHKIENYLSALLSGEGEKCL